MAEELTKNKIKEKIESLEEPKHRRKKKKKFSIEIHYLRSGWYHFKNYETEEIRNLALEVLLKKKRSTVDYRSKDG